MRERYWWEDEHTPLPPPRFAGLALGRLADFSAVCVLERVEAPPPAQPGVGLPHYAVRQLKRWLVGTDYATIVEEVTRQMEQTELRYAPLAVDQTGVGRQVVDLLCLAGLGRRLCPVTLVVGQKPVANTDSFHVRKKELVGRLQVLLQSGRLRVESAVPECRGLLEELVTYQTKNTPGGSERFGAWREGTNDDLVLAPALAAWLGEHEVKADAGPAVRSPHLRWWAEYSEAEFSRLRLQELCEELDLNLDLGW
jgi:hypothetical protein